MPPEQSFCFPLTCFAIKPKATWVLWETSSNRQLFFLPRLDLPNNGENGQILTDHWYKLCQIR